MGSVAALEVVAQAVALNRVGQNDGRPVLRRQSTLVGGKNLAVVVTTTAKMPNVLIRHIFDEFRGAGIAAEEVLADICPVVGLERLEIAVMSVVHEVDQGALFVGGEELVPLAPPHDLDDGPAGTAEEGLQFLDDLRVAADRAVETLQVTVHDEGEVVQVVERRDLQEATRFWLIHLAITEERPHVLRGRVLNTTVKEVAVEPRLENRFHGTEAHRHSREFPEVGHPMRVRIGGETTVFAGDFLAEAIHVLFA